MKVNNSQSCDGYEILNKLETTPTEYMVSIKEPRGFKESYQDNDVSQLILKN